MSTTGVQGGDTADAPHTWVQRQGTGRWVGHNDRGGRVEIGTPDAPGVFSPGELLKIALAGCVGLTIDAPLERRIGPDGPATVEVDSTAVPGENRYDRLTAQVVVDLSGFDETARARLFASLHRSVAGHCTVGRTLEAGATATFTVTGEVEAS